MFYKASLKFPLFKKRSAAKKKKKQKIRNKERKSSESTDNKVLLWPKGTNWYFESWWTGKIQICKKGRPGDQNKGSTWAICAVNVETVLGCPMVSIIARSWVGHLGYILFCYRRQIWKFLPPQQAARHHPGTHSTNTCFQVPTRMQMNPSFK